MLLFPMLQVVLPLQALNPVHGVVQMAGNLHRLVLRYQEVDFRLVLKFALGCLTGSMVAVWLPLALPEKIMLIALGVIVISNVILAERLRALGMRASLLTAGVIQGFLGPYLGVIGGMTSSALLSCELSHKSRATQLAATGLIANTSKTIVFASWGINFSEWLPTVVVLISASILGTWCGVLWGEKINQDQGTRILKALIVVAGLKMIASGI